jgi:Holliday junction resolvase
VSAGKTKGTRAETAIVNFLRACGFRWADRVPLSGNRDRGDVVIGPGSPVHEVKNQNRHSLAEWLDEAEQEAQHARAPFGVVWAKRRGKGSPADWYVLMSGRTYVQMLAGMGFLPEPEEKPIAGQLDLEDGVA